MPSSPPAHRLPLTCIPLLDRVRRACGAAGGAVEPVARCAGQGAAREAGRRKQGPRDHPAQIGPQDCGVPNSPTPTSTPSPFRHPPPTHASLLFPPYSLALFLLPKILVPAPSLRVLVGETHPPYIPPPSTPPHRNKPNPRPSHRRLHLAKFGSAVHGLLLACFQTVRSPSHPLALSHHPAPMRRSAFATSASLSPPQARSCPGASQARGLGLHGSHRVHALCDQSCIARV
jgi:hypothetical protein